MSILPSPEYVSSGSRVTYTGKFGSWLLSAPETPTDTIKKVGDYLRNNYQLILEKSTNGITWLSSGGSITLVFRTDIDRGDGEQDDGLSDILANVNEAFMTLGHDPINSVLNNYHPAPNPAQPSAAPSVIDTGAALPVVVPTPTNTTSSSDNSGIGEWFSGLFTKLEAGSIGFVFGAVAIIGVGVYLAVRE